VTNAYVWTQIIFKKNVLHLVKRMAGRVMVFAMMRTMCVDVIGMAGTVVLTA
jgi:hypothetical protein